MVHKKFKINKYVYDYLKIIIHKLVNVFYKKIIMQYKQSVIVHIYTYITGTENLPLCY